MAYADLFQDDDEEQRRRQQQGPSATTAMVPTGPDVTGMYPGDRPPEQPIDQVGVIGQNPAGVDSSRLPSGVPEDWARDFLQRNPGDYHRIAEAYQVPTSHRPYDSQTTNANEMQQNAIADAQRGTASSASRLQMPGQVPFGNFEFDDASTQRLEQVGAAQLGQIRDNPALNQMLDYLQSQFATRSQTPGFTPEEMAVLRTQAFEPVEDYRNASKDRARLRAAQGGFLPSSGIHELDLRDIDATADRTRTQVDRDVAISNIDRSRQDQSEAQRIAQLLGLTIPQGQRSEELNVAQMLYQLPRNALQDALAVVNGTSSPNDAFNQSMQLQQQRDRERAAQEARDAAFWGQIADLFSRIFS